MGNSKSKAEEEVPEEDPFGGPDLSLWQMVRTGYSELVNAIIRPPRAEYSIEHLGPKHFRFGGRRFERTDFVLKNSRDMRINCSMWQPEKGDRPSEKMPCCIFLHGNASCRIGGLACLRVCLGIGINVLSFDFCGSGMSEGEYVTLGWYEREDLSSVVEYLREQDGVSTVALWGRSMGAVTALLHGDRDPSIAAMVLDSPFCDLKQLCNEMVDVAKEQGLKAPRFAVSMVIKMLRSSVKKTAKFDINKLKPIDHVDRTFIPALFAAAQGDNFIKPIHSQKLYELYGSEDKNIITFEGDHNSVRPSFFLDSVGIFLCQAMQVDPEHFLFKHGDGDGGPSGSLPWETGRFGGFLDAEDDMIRHTMGLGGMLMGEREDLSSFQDWECPACTLFNNGSRRRCQVCGEARPAESEKMNFGASKSSVDEEEEEARTAPAEAEPAPVDTGSPKEAEEVRSPESTT